MSGIKDWLHSRICPTLWRLLWTSAPGPVAGTIFLRVLGGLMPLGMLYAAKQIIDMISAAAQGKTIQQGEVWFWVGIEFGLAALGHGIGRGVDFLDGLISDRFSLGLGLKIMRHAATLDLSSFEDPAFHDRLVRARAQSTDRTKMLASAGWLLQRFVMLGSLAGGIVFYAPWLLVVLFLCVVPSFLVESHFAFLGYGLAHDSDSRAPVSGLFSVSGQQSRGGQGNQSLRPGATSGGQVRIAVERDHRQEPQAGHSPARVGRRICRVGHTRAITAAMRIWRNRRCRVA